MTCRIAVIPMTLTDFQGHLPFAVFCFEELVQFTSYSYNCVAVDKISTDMARRAVPLR